jgi:hypothetical protein
MNNIQISFWKRYIIHIRILLGRTNRLIHFHIHHHPIRTAHGRMFSFPGPYLLSLFANVAGFYEIGNCVWRWRCCWPIYVIITDPWKVWLDFHLLAAAGGHARQKMWCINICTDCEGKGEGEGEGEGALLGGGGIPGATLERVNK